MSKQAERMRRVPMARATVRATLSAREVDRELARFRPSTVAAVRSLEV